MKKILFRGLKTFLYLISLTRRIGRYVNIKLDKVDGS